MHASNEMLLRYQSGELGPAERDALSRHLSDCEACRAALEELDRLFEELRDECAWRGEQGLVARMNTVTCGQPALLRRMPWRALAGSSAVALVVVGALLWNAVAVPVSAAELVKRAVEEESGRPSSEWSRISLHSRFGACNPGSNGAAAVNLSHSPCTRIEEELASVHWDLRHPLSARSFSLWRSSLATRRDEVIHNAHHLILRTTTTSGALRAAALEVRESDYRVVAERLEFGSADAVEILEETSPVPTAPVVPAPPAPVTVVAVSPRTTRIPVETVEALPHSSYIDEAEIEARLKLHERWADGGFEAVVRRTGDSVEVVGLTNDSARATELISAVSGIPGVTVHIASSSDGASEVNPPFPLREMNNPLPPLAAEWLKEAQPDSEARGEFVSRVLGLSKSLLGAASTIHALRERRADLPFETATHALSSIEHDYLAKMSVLIARLRPEIEPLTGPLSEPGEVSLEQAQILDTALIRVLSATRPRAGSLDENLERIRRAFDAPGAAAGKYRTDTGRYFVISPRWNVIET